MKAKRTLPMVTALLLALALVGCGAAAAGPDPSSAESVPAPSSAPPVEPEPEVEAETEPPAITVRYLEGGATVYRDGWETSLAMDIPLYQGDEVVTHSDGMVVLKLDGDKQVQLAPDSHVEIAGFERGDGGDKTLLHLHRGSIVNILDAPLGDADSYAVETPTLVMAIRGTIASVSSDPESGESRVLLFEGRSAVRGSSGGKAVEIPAGGFARAQEGLVEEGAFTGADLNRNEYWFLYEAEYAALFDEPGVAIEKRLEPLLDTQDYRDEAQAAGAVGGSPTAGAGGTSGKAADTGTTPAGGTGAGGTAAPGGHAPAAQPPANTPPAANEAPQNNGGGGMDEGTFRAIEQEFLQAKESYNNGSMGKDEFLAIKQRYIDAKQQYYGG